MQEEKIQKQLCEGYSSNSWLIEGIGGLEMAVSLTCIQVYSHGMF